MRYDYGSGGQARRVKCKACGLPMLGKEENGMRTDINDFCYCPDPTPPESVDFSKSNAFEMAAAMYSESEYPDDMEAAATKIIETLQTIYSESWCEKEARELIYALHARAKAEGEREINRLSIDLAIESGKFQATAELWMRVKAELSAANEKIAQLKEAINESNAVLNHGIELEHFTPHGSTARWAQDTIDANMAILATFPAEKGEL